MEEIYTEYESWSSTKEDQEYQKQMNKIRLSDEQLVEQLNQMGIEYDIE